MSFPAQSNFSTYSLWLALLTKTKADSTDPWADLLALSKAPGAVAGDSTQLWDPTAITKVKNAVAGVLSTADIVKISQAWPKVVKAMGYFDGCPIPQELLDIET